MNEELVWEYSQKQFLVLDPGTLATSFYLPPLIDVNPHMEYGNKNFIKALMGCDLSNPQLIILVWRRDRMRKVYDQNVNFVHAMDCAYRTEEGAVLTVTKLLYDVPSVFHADYREFAAGNFSKMSEKAKEEIRVMSGVRYRSPGAGNTFIYDKKLLVLDKSPILRTYLEKMLDTTIDPDAELLDSPGAESYWVD